MTSSETLVNTMKEELPLRNFSNLIFEFRGIKVMIDVDLAVMYGTETKKLKQQVRRNRLRFPYDFMFVLKKEEKQMLLSLAPRLAHLKHSSVNPMVFTEQGVSMLSSVLTTKSAIKMNIDIMRYFSRYRALILEDKDLNKEIIALDRKLNESMRFMLGKIDALAVRFAKRKRIGFKIPKKRRTPPEKN
jgi:hypothetical protein